MMLWRRAAVRGLEGGFRRGARSLDRRQDRALTFQNKNESVPSLIELSISEVEVDSLKYGHAAPRGRPEPQLNFLRMAIEMGFCRNVRKAIETWGPNLEAEKNPTRRAEYARLRRKAERMFELETIHGAGSLLELDHPIVVSLRSPPRPSFRPHEIEAAEKYKLARRTNVPDLRSDTV